MHSARVPVRRGRGGTLSLPLVDMFITEFLCPLCGRASTLHVVTALETGWARPRPRAAAAVDDECMHVEYESVGACSQSVSLSMGEERSGWEGGLALVTADWPLRASV